MGVQPATKKLWVNKDTIQKLQADPRVKEMMEQDVWITSKGHRIVYIQDPDGIFLRLYDHPEELWGNKILDHY